MGLLPGDAQMADVADEPMAAAPVAAPAAAALVAAPAAGRGCRFGIGAILAVSFMTTPLLLPAKKRPGASEHFGV